MSKNIPAKKGMSSPAPLDSYSTPYRPQAAAPIQSPAAAPADHAAAPPVRWDQALPADFSQIHIDKGLPIPAISGRPAVDWAPLLRLLQPGDSCQLPLGARYTLSARITQTHKNGSARYQIRTNPASQTLRVWRVS